VGNTPLNLPRADLGTQILHRTSTTARRRQSAHDGIEQSRLAGAIAADYRNNTAPSNGNARARHCRDLAITGRQIGNLQNGMPGLAGTHTAPLFKAAPPVGCGGSSSK